MLAQLAAAYADTINGGRVPDVESAWGFVCRAEGEKAVYECAQEIESAVAAAKAQVMTGEQLSAFKSALHERVMRQFR